MTLLDAYYVLSFKNLPVITAKTLTGLGIPADLIVVVISTDDPNCEDTINWCSSLGIHHIMFERGDYLHDSYLSMMSRNQVEEWYPNTATPSRRFISTRENSLPGNRVYSVMDDDIRFHTSNPFRLIGTKFDHTVWEIAREALQDPSVWACSFVNQYTWRGSYKTRGIPARLNNESLWHRTGQLSAQSVWVLSNREVHQWYSPILEDYITMSMYSTEGRWCYILDEYSHVEQPNKEGIWKDEDPLDRNTLAYYVGLVRIMGVSKSDTGAKPFKKYSRYMFPHLRRYPTKLDLVISRLSGKL